MLRIRVIPVLLVKGQGFVKTVRFSKPTYLGDPINLVRLFNDKEADELCILDIDAQTSGKGPNFSLISQLTSECFMPLSYGGGVSTLKDAKKLIELGVEKIVLGSLLNSNPKEMEKISASLGSQSVVAAIDVKKSLFGRYSSFHMSGTKNLGVHPVSLAKTAESLGAGEILLQSIDKDGTFTGFDLDLISQVSGHVQVPVIACSGAKSTEDLALAIQSGASAVAAGSMFVFHGRHRAVLVNMPDLTDFHQRTQTYAAGP